MPLRLYKGKGIYDRAKYWDTGLIKNDSKKN
jgi:hypothetical protein